MALEPRLNPKMRKLKIALAKKSHEPEGKTLMQLCEQWQSIGGSTFDRDGSNCACTTHIKHIYSITNKHTLKRIDAIGSKCIRLMGTRRMVEQLNDLERVRKVIRTEEKKKDSHLRCDRCHFKRIKRRGGDCKCSEINWFACPHCRKTLRGREYYQHMETTHADIIYANATMGFGKFADKRIFDLCNSLAGRKYMYWFINDCDHKSNQTKRAAQIIRNINEWFKTQ